MTNEIPIIPGRGLNTPSAVQMRQDYLEKIHFHFPSIKTSNLQIHDLKSNIESYVGSVEIPVGIVGPLLFKQEKEQEKCYTFAATLEGALVASMNRGARAISLSGGFSAYVLDQKMLRTPAFIFEKTKYAIRFTEWIKTHFSTIKKQAELYSNHAKLQEIETIVLGKTVHARFYYTTADASGQNMTTTCTWHAMLWIVDEYEKQIGVKINDYVLEGNGASDKKASYKSAQSGRGVHVVAEVFLKEEVIHRILRTSSDDLLKYYANSVLLSKLDGMHGYSINVANAIAAIFAATGQDLASIHESAGALLFLEKTDEGLYLSLNLPNLVIGTVGGGTHLPAQSEALDVMRCKGTGKVERFAELIAGFALGLEISTYSAIVSGEFAKAHEKLGRNRPVKRLTRAEITPNFVKKMFSEEFTDMKNSKLQVDTMATVENGIITALTNRVSNKTIGFIPVFLENEDSKQEFYLKSKPLDVDVINGLHSMAASIDTKLSDLLYAYRSVLEYNKCHLKEIELYEFLQESHFDFKPTFYGKYLNGQREIFLFLMEKFDLSKIGHIDSQKNPEWWTEKQRKSVIEAISVVHNLFFEQENKAKLPEIKEFEPWNAKPLYKKFMELMLEETEEDYKRLEITKLLKFIDEWSAAKRPDLPLTVVHNDFNSRNIAIRKNGKPVIYDWELAVVNIPHRDIVEFLSFTLIPEFELEELKTYLELHYKLIGKQMEWNNWLAGYEYAVKEYIITRISFYEVAGILAKYAFSERVFEVSLRLLQLIPKLRI